MDIQNSAYGEIQRQCLRGQCICTVNPAGNLDRLVPLRVDGEERVLLRILLPLLPRSQRRPRCLGYLGIVTPKLGLYLNDALEGAALRLRLRLVRLHASQERWVAGGVHGHDHQL